VLQHKFNEAKSEAQQQCRQPTHKLSNTHTEKERKRGQNGSHVQEEFPWRLGNKNKIKVNCSRPAIFYVIILQIAKHRERQEKGRRKG